MEIQLREESRKVLEILAREYELTPETRRNGISEEVLGARAGCYLNMSYKAIAELRRAKFVSQLPNYNVIITEEGYKYARPRLKRFLMSLSERRTGTILVILTIILIIIGVITLFLI